MLSFWAISSSTHMGMCPQQPSRPDFYGGIKVSSSGNVKGNPYTPGKTGKTGEPTWHWPKRVQEWPQLWGHRLSCWEHSLLQAARLCLISWRTAATWAIAWLAPMEPVVGGIVQGLLLETPCSLESDSAFTSYTYGPLGIYFTFLSLRFLTCKVGMLLPPTIVVRIKGDGICKVAQSKSSVTSVSPLLE